MSAPSPGNAARQRLALRRICGNDGGLFTRSSSPIVMWLGDQLAQLGELAVAVVADDQAAPQ